MKKNIFLSLAFALSVLTLAAQETFDTAADYTTNFKLNNGTDGSYVHNSGLGVGGDAGFMDIGTAVNAAQNNFQTGLTKTIGDIYQVSYFIKIGTPANDINDYRAGFVRSTGSLFGGAGSDAVAYLRSDAGVSTYTIELIGDGTSAGETSQFSLTADTWYEFQVQMTLDSETQADLSAQLFNRGADGTSAATTVTGSAISASDVALASGGFNGANVFSGFTTRNNSGSVGQGMDNYSFAVVPEPSAYALISGFLALGWIMVRRRR